MRVAIAGSTGSIGTQTLDVVRAAVGRVEVSALSARSSVDLLVAQACEFFPDVVVVGDPSCASAVAAAVPAGTAVVVGDEGPEALAAAADVVVNGVVGFAGLAVTIAAVRAGRRLALANKESLVAGGPVVRAALAASAGAELVPVDSEHAAIHQCLRAGSASEVSRLILTASGGPFRGLGPAELHDVTLAQALAHPTWQMGPKITVDSSTLMNKGLEVIEADELFGVGFDRIEVVVHPQSIVHSMVEFVDGSTVAQLSRPDMRGPIAYALGLPERWPPGYGVLDWAQVGRLDFEPPDRVAFPCLDLAYQAGRAGGSAPAWLNAANEVAVAAFLDGALTWRSIPDVLNRSLDLHDGTVLSEINDVIEVDARARSVAVNAVAQLTGGAVRS